MKWTVTKLFSALTKLFSILLSALYSFQEGCCKISIKEMVLR